MKALEAGDRLAAEARERAEKATNGPWQVEPYAADGAACDCRDFLRNSLGLEGPLNVVSGYEQNAAGGCSANWIAECDLQDSEPQNVENARFIADARQSVPALAAEVERRGKAIRHIPHCGVCLVDLKYHDRFCPEVAAILEGK